LCNFVKVLLCLIEDWNIHLLAVEIKANKYPSQRTASGGIIELASYVCICSHDAERLMERGTMQRIPGTKEQCVNSLGREGDV
jgi:hypothetical protein